MDAKKKRGQAVAGGIISLMIGILILAAVVVPVVAVSISNLALTGIADTIADLFVPMLMLGGFMLIIYTFFTR